MFACTARRAAVAAFYRDVIGLAVESIKDDSAWFAPEGARLVVHEWAGESDAPVDARGHGFVVWFGVDDIEGAYARAKAAGVVVGHRYRDHFFASDPEGRFIGVRAEP